jgi:hypothetical protein
MQHFDGVIKEMIERKVVPLEDGLAFATNQNNLLLELKGVSGKEDFMHGDDNVPTPARKPQRNSPVVFELN